MKLRTSTGHNATVSQYGDVKWKGDLHRHYESDPKVRKLYRYHIDGVPMDAAHVRQDEPQGRWVIHLNGEDVASRHHKVDAQREVEYELGLTDYEPRDLEVVLLAQKPPKGLRKTEAYADSPEGAARLWLDGFRPIEAQALQRGMTVAYRRTELFTGNAVGDVMTARVQRVTVADYEVHVVHTGGETDCDEGDEVWTKQEDVA